MSEKTKDVIILICISAISAIFFFFCSYCEFADHQAYESGEICECHGEFGFEYTEFFIRGLVSVISGMIIVFLRIVLEKKLKRPFWSILFIVTFLINALLFFIG